jgi:SAM-dependent methyltransferase
MMFAVKNGEGAYRHTHGADLWQQMAGNPKLAEAFDNEMDVHVRSIGPRVLDAYEWSTARSVVDVGGGTGHLLKLILAAETHLVGTLVEFAEAVERARLSLPDESISERFEIFEGSFFDPLPPGADIYLLSWVLHDWPDEAASRILDRCRAAVSTSGRVLVIEKPHESAQDTDLDVRMLTFFGGRERTTAQYLALAARSELTFDRSIDLGMDFSLLVFRPRLVDSR